MAGGAGGALTTPKIFLKKLTTGSIMSARYWQMPCERRGERRAVGELK